MADGYYTIGSWTVSRNYRSRMMADGQRVILWATGDGRRIARGIWGLGYVTGPHARGVVLCHSRPYHPQTFGKVEHQRTITPRPDSRSDPGLPTTGPNVNEVAGHL